DRIVGHAAFSPVTIGDGTAGWFGLGPVAVEPDEQGKGIGAALIEEGLARLRRQGAAGCVVLGDAAYYARFGFRCEPSLRYLDASAHYFQALSFTNAIPSGEIAFHTAFG
ncbi:MAG TPA: N-acetyltransferase, partial [Novosphingobium sp.]|nr:N-acetyltransferase [Novosphingobium sp.]